MSDAELASPREGADQVLPSEQSEQGGIAALAEIELTTEGLRSLALKCQEWPEAAKEIQVLGEHLRDGAKGIKGLRADNNVRDDGLLEVLKTIDGKQFDLVMTVAKGSHCCRDLIQAVLDAEAKIDSLLGPRGGVNNTKFSPDMIRFERKQLEAKIEDIVKVEQVLEKLCDSSEQKKALRTLQDASDQLLSSNILSEVKTYLEERKQIAEQLKEVEMDRGRQDAQLRLKKAELEMMEEQLRQREEAAKEIQSDLGSKKAALETMTRQVLMSKEDLVHRCQARKMEAEKEIEQMRAKQQEAEKRSQGPIEECEQKTLELQKQLMNLDSHNINHIIIAVDKSSSMKCGQRWKRAVQAVDAMRKALVAAGSIDKVSVVCFDSQAFRLASSVPVTFDFVPKLQATAPSGSTEFLHAWQCISDCAMDDPKFARVFVIFVTDGLSAIGQAAAKARQLLQRLGAQKRSMCAFFVHIVERSSGNTEVAKVQSALKPLVKAANGGQTRLACMDQKVELLQVVHAEELLSAFERLADLVGIEKSVLQARIALLQKMEKERRAKQREELQHLRDYYKDMVASLCETVRAAEKASASDTDHMKELYSKLEAETRNDLTQLEGRLQNAMNAAHEGKQQLVRCKAEYESLQQNFESGKSLHEKESSNLKKMSATHAEKLTSLVEKQTNLVQSYGSTTSKQLLEQVEALERMKKHFWQNCLMEQDLYCLVRNVAWASCVLKELLEHSTAGGRKISNSKVVLHQLLKRRGLEYKEVPQEDMTALLKYEASMRGIDADEACQAILAAGVGPEQICQPASEVEEEKVQESKKELIDILRSKTFSLEGCEAQSIEKALKSAKKELEHKKEELKTQKEKLKAQRQKQQELQRSRRLKAASEESASSDEDGWVKIEEDLQDRICELSDEKEACEGRIQALEADLKKLKEEQADVIKRLQPCSRLLEQVVDTCREAFQHQVAEEEQLALRLAFDCFRNKVQGPMSDFLWMADRAKQALKGQEKAMLTDCQAPVKAGKQAAIKGA